MINNSKILPLTYLLLAIVAMIMLHFVFPIVTIVSAPWNVLGLIPLGIGVGANFVASNLFSQLNTTIKPFSEPNMLITSGLYRFSRNPMYLGFGLILAGIALLLGTMLPFLIVPGFMLLLETRFIREEENRLAQKFGPDWLVYRQQVRRWI
jgi:protein-S-isoprenylcysteine O-methyltransferase Ste14